MEGTDEFLDLDDKDKNCQNEKSVLECRSKKYLDIGKEKCNCTPHHLRTYNETVSIFKGVDIEWDHACHSLYTAMDGLFPFPVSYDIKEFTKILNWSTLAPAWNSAQLELGAKVAPKTDFLDA